MAGQHEAVITNGKFDGALDMMARQQKVFLAARCSLRGFVLAVLLLCSLPGIASGAPLPEAALEHFEAASRYREAGELRAAVIELKNALQRHPDYAEARLLLGETYLQLGDAASAESQLRRAERLGAEKARVAVPLGRALLLQGRFEQVLSEFDPEDFAEELAGDILLLRADALSGLGQSEEARGLYDQVAEQRPADPRAYLGRARLALAMRDPALAEAQAGEALARDPENTEALLVEGEAKRLGGRLEEAVGSFEAALDVRPASAATIIRARLGLAATLLALARDQEAEAELEALEAAAPGLPLAAYLGALVKLRQQDMEGARRRLDAGGPALADFAPARFLLAIVAYASGELETSRSWLKRHLVAMPENLPARKLLAAMLLRLNALDEAARELETARSQAPQDPQVLMMLANVRLRAGETTEALELLRRSAELAPEDPKVLGQLAIGHLASGESGEALAALNATLDLDEDASALGYAIAFVHLRAGQFAEALAVARDLRRRFPTSALAANLEGGARAGLRQMEAARKAFEAAVDLDPTLHEARANLAALKARDGDLAAAEGAYQEILKVDATELRALIGMAGLAERRGDRAALRAWLEKAVTAHPNAVQPSLALAEFHAATGDAEAAAAVLEPLVVRRPREAEVLLRLGGYQSQAGQVTAALATYRRLVDATGGSPAARLLLAETQLSANDIEGARSSYEFLVKAVPSNPVVWNNLAWIYHQAGDARAAEHGEKALALASGHPAVLDTLGWILASDEIQLGRARDLLEQAHRAAPDSGEIAYHYAVALHRLGKDRDARAILQKLLQEDEPFPARADAEALLQVLMRGSEP